MLKYLLCAASIILSGCATVKPYFPPETGPRARFAIQSTQNLDFGSTYFIDSAECRWPHHLGSGTNDKRIVLPADREATFVAGTGKNPTCNIFFGFVPEDGQQYVANLTTKGNQCFLALGKLVNGKLQPFPFKQKEAWNDASPWGGNSGQAFCRDKR